MKVIWKFPIPQRDRFTVEMPGGAQVLSVQVQHGQPVIWALVDNDVETVEERPFWMFGTGHDMPAGLSYIGTIQMADGDFIWHLFDLAPSAAPKP